MKHRDLKQRTVFTDFLGALGVPFTSRYSNGRFHSMTFKSLFGLSKLLQEYGIETRALRLSDKKALAEVPTPFLAQYATGFVTVTRVCDGGIEYLKAGKPLRLPLAEFERRWSGVILQGFPTEKSREPEYCLHHVDEIGDVVKRWLLLACFLFLFGYLFVVNGIWRNPATIVLSLLNTFGVYITCLLIQKELHITSHAADRVCGVLQAGGCNTVLEQKASTFFGLFGWAEVGFAYFSVSLGTLMFFPQYAPYLALINVCCLPFTVWSIWYQRMRAHAWCTLCVTVQLLLWCCFFCYLLGGLFHGCWPLGWPIFAIGAAYLGVMLTVNRLLPLAMHDA